MSADSADRSFTSVVTLAATPYAAAAGLGCGLVWHLWARIADGALPPLSASTLVPVLPVLGVMLLLCAGAAAGAWTLIGHLRANARLARHVHAARTPCHGAAVPADVVVVDAAEPFAFTYGLRRARVALSLGLLERLSVVELEAVVAHERYHQHHRDPLRLLIARVAVAACFFLPSGRHLFARYLAGRELAADRCALDANGSAALAGALCKAVPGPGWDELRSAAPIAVPELLALRVEQLEQGAEPPLPAMPTTSLITSAAMLALLAALITIVSVRLGVLLCAFDVIAERPLAVVLGLIGASACAALLVCLTLAALRRVLTASDDRAGSLARLPAATSRWA